MNQNEKNEIKEVLSDRKLELKRVIVDSEQVLADLLIPDEAGDSRLDFNQPADSVNADPDRDKIIQLLDQQRAELTLVNQALDRIENDTYGSCQSCSEEISFPRLKAIPYTRYCLRCQKIEEKERKQRSVSMSRRGPDLESYI